MVNMFDRIGQSILLGALALAPAAHAASSAYAAQSSQAMPSADYAGASAACLSGAGDCQTYGSPSAMPFSSSVPQLNPPLIGDPTDRGFGTAGYGQAQKYLQGFPSVPAKPLTCMDTARLNDFQKYLCRTVGSALPVFGQHVFAGGQNGFAPQQAMPVSPDYLMNVGDEFVLRTWGQLDAELSLKVDRAGQVFIPRVGNINVVGVPFGALKSHLSREIGRVFRNFDLAVTMGQLRSVQVFVVGFARKPGSYTLGSLSTVVNALIAAGGPDQSGSLRQIQIKRGNRVVSQFDLYDLLLKGDKSADLLLQSGDVVFVPAAGPQVAIHGSVKAPAIYELKGKETLKDLIDLAGGADQYALDGQISIERLSNQKGRSLESLPLKQAGQFALRGGDIAQIYGVSSKVDQVVSLRGNVAQPVRQGWRKGMKVSDLIISKEMLQSPDYWEGKSRGEAGSLSGKDAQQSRLLQEPGQSTDYFTAQLSPDSGKALGRSTSTTKSPRIIRSDTNEINWDYAVIERTNPVTMSTTLVPFNLAKALDKDPAEDRELESGDIITVFSKSDIQLNSSKRTRVVRLEGEVAIPGFYEVQEGETLRDLVKRVGGLSKQAYLFGAEFNRESVRQKQQKELEKYTEELQQSARRQAADQAANAIRAETALGAQTQAKQTQEMAEKLKTLRSTGRIVLGVKPEDKTANELPAIALEDGDRLYVPHTPGTVDVLGTVFSRNNAYMYVQGKEIEDYLEQAGGPTPDADEKSIHVVRADGSVISARQKSAMAFWRSFDSTNALPGDTIVVPEKVDRTKFVKNLMDWTQILSNFGVGVAAMKTLGD